MGSRWSSAAITRAAQTEQRRREPPVSAPPRPEPTPTAPQTPPAAEVPAEAGKRSTAPKPAQRPARLRPAFSSTPWDLAEDTPAFRWVAHGISKEQKQALDEAARAAGIQEHL